MKKNFKILAFEVWPTLLAGGQERSLFEVIEGLKNRGVKVSLAYETDGDLVSKYEDLQVNTFKILTNHLILKSIRCPLNILDFFISAFRIFKQNFSKHGKWDVIYVNQYADVTLAAFCGLILRIPVVCHLRLAASSYISRQFVWGVNRCKLLISNSEYTARTYVDYGFPAKKIAVVLNAINTEIFSPIDNDKFEAISNRENRKVLYIGRISPEKGIEVLINAVAIARTLNPNITLIIVGNLRGDGASASYYDHLTKLAQDKLGISVQFHSASQDVVGYYRDTDLTVLPAVWDEPFGRVVIESMSCGVPCIASCVGGIPEILQDKFDSFLFERGNSEKLAVAILQHINWRTDNPILANQCRQLVLDDFFIEKMHGKIFDAFDQLINSKS